MLVTPVTFRNNKASNLFGMLHSPTKTRRNIGIIILCPGIKSRVAPHRLYVKMAQRFSGLGFEVLRFDPEGIGDSEGEIDELLTADVYGSVELGRFVKDTIAAMDWMEREHGLTRFILSGLCGGAITGLLTGARDNRVHSLLGLGIPVILDGSNFDRRHFLTKGELIQTRTDYLRKLVNPKAWLRLFSFKSDFRLILISFLALFKTKANESKSCSGHTNGVTDEHEKHSHGNFNPYFPTAFKRFASSRKMLLIFSQADKLYWEFEEKFVSEYRRDFQQSAKNVQIDVVKGANHIFSFSEWQMDMLDISCAWLNKHY